MARLLILDDRTKDADLLIGRPAIKEYLHNDSSSIQPVYISTLQAVKNSDVRKASIVIAQTREVALAIVQRQKFDFVISDLLLFDPEIVNAIKEEDYFSCLSIEDRMRQIANPDGLGFLNDLRSATNSTEGTSPNVPIIAMTFFWRHPRFESFYLRKIRSIRGPSIGYLPKYYWIKSRNILDKGDKTLELLMKALATPSVANEITREMIPLLFDAVALDLFIHKNRFDVNDTLQVLRTSYHDSCRSVVDFKMVFKIRNIPEPESSVNVLQYIMEKLTVGEANDVAISVKFDNVPKAKSSTETLTSRELTHPPEEELLRIHSRGDRSPALRKFGICLALALYTYPLAHGPHSLPAKILAAILSKAVGEPINDLKIRQDINSIRNDLQRLIPAGLADFVSAEHHLIVSEGKLGYYLNGTYDIDWNR